MIFIWFFRCTIAELFSEGNSPPFLLTTLLKYRTDPSYYPNEVLDKIEDTGIKVI